MKTMSKNIQWDVAENQAHLFRQYGLEDPERLIEQSRVVKEAHERTVYRHRDDLFYMKRMRPGKARKEWRNWIGLYDRGVPTITPVALGVSQKQGYLISPAHHEFVRFYDVFDSAGPGERLRLLEKLGKTIKAMHTARFYHGDLHGGNFLARWHHGEPEVLMLDFQRGRFCRISHRQKQSNLADLAVSRYFILSLRERLAFLAGYFGSIRAAADFMRTGGRGLENLILHRADQVADGKVRRFRKVNKYFERLNAAGPEYKGVCFRENRAFIPSPFLLSPLKFLYGNHVQVLKDSRSVRVIRYREVCIKYYKCRGPKDILKGRLGLSKGKKSFRWALALFYRRIPTPRPLCYMDGRRGDSFYLSLFLDSAQKLSVYLERGSPAERQACLNALAPLMKAMFYRGIYHLDLKSSNILVKPAAEGLHFALIDTDGVAIFRKGSRTLLRKTLLRTIRALSRHAPRDALMRFSEHCLSGLPGPMNLRSGVEALVDRAIRIEAGRQPKQIR